MTLPTYLTFQSLMSGQSALISATVASSASPAAPTDMVLSGSRAVVDWDEEPTNPMIDVSAFHEPTIVDDGPIPAHVGLQLIEYGIAAEDVDRLCAWMHGKRLRLNFMTKGIEYLAQMRREERMDEEVTQVLPAAARRRV
ncbi:MAG TPA: hypothetical protein VLJ37_07450 [bacterium]|nr:hypothetical protein [bacterium]